MTAPDTARCGVERAFNPARRAHSAELHQIASEAAADADSQQRAEGDRKHVRKGAELEDFLRITRSLLSDVACAYLDSGLTAHLRIGLRSEELTGERGPHPVLKRPLPKLLQALHATGWLEVTNGSWGGTWGKGQQTMFCAGQRLIHRMREAGVTAAHTRLDYSGEEVIRLRGPKTRGQGDDDEGPRIRYEDTDETERLRAEMLQVNTAIHERIKLDVADGDGCFRQADLPYFARRFTQGSWNCGGRLWDIGRGPGYYGWTNPKKARKKGLISRLDRMIINGEDTASADIKSCSVSILYAMAGLTWNGEDAYTPPELRSLVAEDDRRRDVLKQLWSANLNCSRRLTRWPDDLLEELRKQKMTVAEVGFTASEAVVALERLHQPVAHLLREPNIGHRVLRIESDVLVHALLSAPHLCALPLHDSVVCPISSVDEAVEVLEASFAAVTGGRCRAEPEC